MSEVSLLVPRVSFYLYISKYLRKNGERGKLGQDRLEVRWEAVMFFFNLVIWNVWLFLLIILLNVLLRLLWSCLVSMRVGFVEGVVAFSFMFNVCSLLLMFLRGGFLASFVWTCSLLESGWWWLWWLGCLVSRYAYVGEGSVECARILHLHRFMCPICLVLRAPLRGLLGFPDGTSDKSQTDNCHRETKDLIWRCFAKLRFGWKSAQTTNMLGQVLRE